VSTALSVADIRTYLAATGWRRQPVRWTSASVWADAAGREVLLPSRDGMGDGELRVRQALDALAAAEERPRDEIARDIASPLVDTQSYRTFPDGVPDGLTTLTGGLRALGGVRSMIEAAARAVVDGPHVAFSGAAPKSVGDLLDELQLGPSLSGSYVLTVRVPLGGSQPGTGGDTPLARRMLLQLHDAVVAVRDAALSAAPSGRLEAFDGTVTEGVSADLCEALSDLGGPAREQPFAVTFRWARGLPAELPATTVRFEAGMGGVIHDAAQRLSRLDAFGDATVTGVVDSLHDSPARGDRWRVKVRGELVTGRGTRARRTIWVRLDRQSAYDRAIAAHRGLRRVRATGALSRVSGRVELMTRGGLEVLD
jgi:hypothetical protein